MHNHKHTHHRHIPTDADYLPWRKMHDLLIEEIDPMQAQLPVTTPQLPLSTHAAGNSALRTPVHPTNRIRRGHVVFDGSTQRARAFQLVEGEIVVLRRGMAVDLIEAGEYVDSGMWSGNTVAVARTDCTLAG